MTIKTLAHPLAAVAAAAATVAFPTTHAAAQLVADAEFKEACEVLRLGGGLDVPEWLAFSRTPALRLDPAGRLYLRGGDPHVAVLDPDGGFVRYIGGEGEGPGEFAHVGGFGFVGDTVWLQHLFELHIALFDTAGAHIRTETDRGLPSSAPSLWRTSIPLAGGYGFYIPPIGDVDLERGEFPDFERVKLPMLVGIRSAESRDTLDFKYNFTAMIMEMGTFGHQPIVVPPSLPNPPRTRWRHDGRLGTRPSGRGHPAPLRPDRPRGRRGLHRIALAKGIAEGTRRFHRRRRGNGGTGGGYGSTVRRGSPDQPSRRRHRRPAPLRLLRADFILLPDTTNARACATRPHRRTTNPSGSFSAPDGEPEFRVQARPASPSRPPSATGSGRRAAPNWRCRSSSNTNSGRRGPAGSHRATL